MVIDDTMQSASIDGHDLFNQTRAYVERLAREYQAHERLHEAVTTIETHVPRETYMLLALALGMLFLRSSLVFLSAWRAVRRHAKAE